MMKKIFGVLIIFLPWKFRRWILNNFFGYKIHRSARIGLSYIYPCYLEMGENAKIDHFTVAIHLDRMIIKANSTIGRSNWITGFPSKTNSKHFIHQENRISELILDEFSAITKHHHLDCTNTISIGKFVTIAGYQSQFLTHSIDIYKNRQDSKPIKIGDYTFIGTNVVVLGGAVLPAYSVLGAKSLLNKAFEEEWKLYGGVPAKLVSEISKEAKYFKRRIGFVD